MAKILFDLLCAQPVGKMKFHGGGEYTKTIFRQLVTMKEDFPNIELVALYNFDLFIDDWILEMINDHSVKTHDVKSIAQIASTVRTYSETNDDVRFFAGMGYGYQGDRARLPPNITSIGTFHGLRVIEKAYDFHAWRYGTTKRILHEFLDWVLLRRINMEKEFRRQQDALASFDTIITVSGHSKYSMIVNFAKEVCDKQVHEFYSPLKYVDHVAGNSGSDNDGYIMMVSADRWIKNSYRGLIALDRLYTSGALKGIKTKVYGNAPKNIVRGLKAKDYFEFYGYVSSEELEEAYSKCRILLYPSLNEGFGYPPLEAMKYGKTCVVSAVCSLPEVYGESVIYVNPYDVMEIENRVLQALDKKIDEAVIAKRVSAIMERQNSDTEKLCKLILGM